MVELELKQEAYELRKTFGFSEDEPIHFKNLCLKERILTFHAPLDDEFSGMAIKVGENRFILINSNHSIGRQHFTLCHELYHLYFDKNFLPHRCQSALFDKRNKNEFSADTFASHFLLPEQGLLSLIPKEERGKNKISIATILKIEQYFSCSRRALLNRLFYLNRISTDYHDFLRKDVKRSAQLHGYSVDLYNPGNSGDLWGDYGILAKQLFDNEKLSEGNFASLMNDVGIDIFKNFIDNEN